MSGTSMYFVTVKGLPLEEGGEGRGESREEGGGRTYKRGERREERGERREERGERERR
jgi:hypothetical protein